MSLQLLLVNDQRKYLEAYERIACDIGFSEICLTQTTTDARELIRTKHFDAAVIDLNLDPEYPDRAEGLELIRELHEQQPDCLIMAYTKHLEQQGVDYDIQSLRAGATDFICENWFGMSHEQLLKLKLKIWFGHLSAPANTTKPILAGV